MRKVIISAIAFSLFAISCKKESGNDSILKADSITATTVTSESNGISTQTQEHTYRYVAEDGSSAHVKFTNSTKDGNYISITSNKKTIKVKQKEAWAKGAIYEENGVIVKSEGDKITIEQENNIIELKKARGQ